MTEQQPALSKQQIIQNFEKSRLDSEALCDPLEIEDYGLQAIAETSPAKWHIAHTSWFYETFILRPYSQSYIPFDDSYEHLFNSYYNTVGQPFLRPKRGLLSRPTVNQIFNYRQHITEKVLNLLDNTHHPEYSTILERVTLGIQHEKQHQELFLTDLKYNFFQNPLLPAYQPIETKPSEKQSQSWVSQDEGLVDIGFNETGFCFDNELPCHKVYLEKYDIAKHPVSNEAYLSFVSDRAYKNPLLWLSDGWTWINQNKVQHPLYWLSNKEGWNEFTLSGLQPLDLNAPVCHLNYFEADAFARWAGYRLPTEFEWEHYARKHKNQLVESMSKNLQPIATSSGALFNQIWQWTQSNYTQYPGFKPAAGAIGEYNGKFMCNQFVLRGGSCFSPENHIRISYRNFFYPADRWQMSGIRLAK
ncbi:ergothioneine biosynthesis protein EgtB [Pleionea sediminis]|uniref:ergothioneine biosynthesis protein EgtB n=1 Tax=Pleionea sediminis TaxID=2569479 RepID=UPI001185FF42|nr:ergothioneine biosynthesis protein EgtB [Pleionea sediminis]